MRTVFLGTSEFAVIVLRALAGSQHAPALVLTRPDRPRGRGRRPSPPPVAVAAVELGLDLYQPESVNDGEARARIAAHEPRVVCICAFGALIKEPLLSSFQMLNVHPSLLPRWRGAAPIERAIIAGDEQTGTSIMRVTAGLDSGPVCAQESVQVGPEDTYGTLAQRLAERGAALLVDVLDGMPACAEQDDSLATYAEKIEREDRRLEPADRAADELERTVRALTPHIGAYLELGARGRLGVRRARAAAPGPAPGELDLGGEVPVLGCRQGALELLEVHPEGRRPMAASDWLRGLR